MNKLSSITMIFAVLSIPMSMGFQEAFAGGAPDEQAVGTVTVNPTCGVTAVGTLNYPPLDVGATTSNADEQIITITNTGNLNVDVIVSGTDWTNTVAPNQPVMDASVTHFSTVDDTAYGAQTVMAKTGSGTANVVLGLTPTNNVDVFHKVQIVLLAGQETFQLTAQQTETFAFNCP